MSEQNNNDFWHNFWQPYVKLDDHSVMFLYGSTLLGLTILYCLIMNPSLTPERYKEMEVERTIETIVRKQQEYLRDNQTFPRQLESLEMYSETKDHSYRILFPSQPVQTQLSFASEFQDLPAIATIAYPKHANSRTYIGVVQTIVEPVKSKLITRLILCRSKTTLGMSKLKRDIIVDLPATTSINPKNVHFSCPVNFQNFEG